MNIPDETIIEIIKFLDIPSYVSLTRTCTRFMLLDVSSLYITTVFDNKIEYRFMGKLHRTDGPALIYFDGQQRWYINDKLHRDNSPAIIWPNGTLFWYQNDKLHRDGGPAIVWSNGMREWFENGNLIKEEL